MSTIKFAGDLTPGHLWKDEKGNELPRTDYGIPERAAVRIEALPKRTLVFAGRVSEGLYIELDPGMYAYAVVRLTGGTLEDRKLDDVSYRGRFLHEIDEPAWVELQHMAPRMCRTLQTQEGTRFVCQVHGCDHRATSPTAALLHEVTDHLGVDREEFLKAPRSVGRKLASKVQAVQATIIKDRATPTKAQLLGVAQEMPE